MSALSNSIDTLAERVDRLERADKRDAGPAAALLLAVGQLRVAALGAGVGGLGGA